jgi:hypothetical protein
MIIREAIHEFRLQNPQWDTPEGAKNQCGIASNAFVRFLASQGIPAYRAEIPAQQHYVVRVRKGRTEIDWTARQFDGGAAYPLVTYRW